MIAPLCAAALIMSVGTHALLLWTRRQQLVHAIRRARLIASDSPFGDDPTCFIEGLSLRALGATLTIDFALDVLSPLVAMQLIALPLFDAAQLAPLALASSLQIRLMRAVAVALICAPCACASLVFSRAIHLASRSSSVVLALRRACTASVHIGRLFAMVVMRDTVALSAVVVALTAFASSLRPSPFGCALPLALGAACGAVLSHPFDSLALDAAAATASNAPAKQVWLGVVPRTARLTMITVCVPFWFTLVSMATAEVAEAVR